MPLYQRAVLYCRIATRIDGSLNEQEEACRKFAEREKYDVADTFTDIAPGKAIQRPGFEDLLADLRKHPGTIVVVEQVSRLASTLEVFRAHRDLIHRHGGRLQTTREIFSDDPAASLIDNLMEAMARAAQEVADG